MIGVKCMNMDENMQKIISMWELLKVEKIHGLVNYTQYIMLKVTILANYEENQSLLIPHITAIS